MAAVRSTATRPSRASAPGSAPSWSGAATRRAGCGRGGRRARRSSGLAVVEAARGAVRRSGLTRCRTGSSRRSGRAGAGVCAGAGGHDELAEFQETRARAVNSQDAQSLRCARRRSTPAPRSWPHTRRRSRSASRARAARRSGRGRAAAPRRAEVELAAAEARTAEREKQISIKFRELTKPTATAPRLGELAKQEAALAQRERALERRPGRARRQGRRGTGAGRGTRVGARDARGDAPRARVRARRPGQGRRRARARAGQGARHGDRARGEP